MYSFVELEKSKINSLIDFTFQMREYTNKEVNTERNNILGALKEHFNSMRDEVKNGKSFEEILQCVYEKEIYFIPKNDDFFNYSPKYMEGIESYKKRIFSDEFLGRVKDGLEDFIEKLEKLNYMITLKNYNFDFESSREKKKGNERLKFQIKMRKAMRDKLDDLV